MEIFGFFSDSVQFRTAFYTIKVTHLWMGWQTLTPTHPFTAPQPLVLLTLVLLRTPVHTYQLTCWRTRGLRGWAELAAKQQISDITVIHDVVVMYFIHILFSKDFWVISLRMFKLYMSSSQKKAGSLIRVNPQ